MSSVNRAMILGRLGQDPEIRYTPGGSAVCTLNVATSEIWNDRDGNRQESTEWHRIVIWGKQAENCAKFLAKGRLVYVEGRIQTRSWDDKNSGQKRYSTEIVGQNVQFIGGNRDSQQPGSHAGMNSHQNSMSGYNSTPPQAPSHDRMPSQMPDPEPNLDDIPF